MYIQFDKKNMHVQVICGILEKYEPNERIELIYNKVEDLKKKMVEFLNTVVDPAIADIEKLINEENNKYNTEEKLKKEE